MTPGTRTSEEMDDLACRFKGCSLPRDPCLRQRSFVSTVVQRQMTADDLQEKLEWFNTVSGRSVRSSTRGKQNQECTFCGYRLWCPGERNFSYFDPTGTYMKWCCDCMAKEMGGTFKPSPELRRAREEKLRKQQNPVVMEPTLPVVAEEPLRPVKITVSKQDRQRRMQEFNLRRSKGISQTPGIPQSSPKNRSVKITISTSEKIRFDLKTNSLSGDSTTAPISTSSSTSSCGNSTLTIPEEFACRNCKVALEGVGEKFSLDGGFRCACTQDDVYCLECAHKMGGQFCAKCSKFVCGQCVSNDDKVYCSATCKEAANDDADDIFGGLDLFE